MYLIIKRLDKIATDLEKKGYIKEASEIDVISNTIEKLAFIYNAKDDPLYEDMSSAINLLKENKRDPAYNLVSKSIKEMLRKKELFGGIDGVKSSFNLFHKALKAFIESKEPNSYIIRTLYGVLHFMEESEEGINNVLNSKRSGKKRRSEYEPFDTFIKARNLEIPSETL
jgi:Mor family transcriptional regulator